MKTLMVMPTWKNETMCGEAIRTLFEYTDFADHGELVVIDNAPQGTHLANICAKYNAWYRPQTENLGWERSINAGGSQSPAQEFDLLTMCNDDVVFPQDREFWPRTFKLFEKDPLVGGVGPVSNYVSGAQYYQLPVPGQVGRVKYLIGFCATYRRELVKLDEKLPGGDDLDISIRLRASGWTLLCDRRSFLYHYGSVTGKRVRSDWDNQQSQLRTANALIEKHGLKSWYDCVNGGWETYLDNEQSPVTDDVMVRVSRELNALAKHLSDLGLEVVEGSSTPKQLEFLIAKTRGLKLVAEIGFNAGVSALTMLEANPDLKLVSFDTAEWPVTDHAVAYLKRKFGDRLTFIRGDSKKSLPVALPMFRVFDLAFVDGGHDYLTALADLVNIGPRAKAIIMDDMNMPSVRRAWESAVEAGFVKQTGLFVDNGIEVPRHWAEGEGCL